MLVIFPQCTIEFSQFLSIVLADTNDFCAVYRPIGLMRRVFANGPADRSLIPGRVIPKTQKMVPDAALLSNPARIKGKVEYSRE